jgi:hypothetical protein
MQDLKERYKQARQFAEQLESISPVEFDFSLTEIMNGGPDEYAKACRRWAAAAVKAMANDGNKKSPRRDIAHTSHEDMTTGLEKFLAGNYKVITKKAKLYLDARILRSGLEFVDSPGTPLLTWRTKSPADMARSRRHRQAANQRTEESIALGVFRLICARMGRLETEERVQDEIRKSIRTVGRGKAFVIVTRIDLRPLLMLL